MADVLENFGNTPSLGEYYSNAESEPALDMDALHTLPLSILPFQTSGLKRARMIKNIQLEGVVEIFNDIKSGSGQVNINQLSTVFDWSEDIDGKDQNIIRKLSNINSYDVYTLRISLRQLGIEVNETEKLKLSESKNKELSKYMVEFTRPLMLQIYGDSDSNIESLDQIIGMFKSPDQAKALENLRRLASSLKIKIAEIPNFIEDYGDIFMSLAYFKECADKILPNVNSFIREIQIFKENRHLSSQLDLMKTCEYLDNTLTYIATSLTERFESFEKHSQDMWNDINPDTFRKVKGMIASHHATLGGVLCGLAVKMGRWQEKFSDGRGGPVQRSEFVMSEMRAGIGLIEQIEKSAPDFSKI
ncbi:MAG: hypothetical protein CMM28_11010 [Rhodospirillaceae bacterium]|nr:hypothetical protein [Rhodospirillaceae bacterium]